MKRTITAALLLILAFTTISAQTLRVEAPNLVAAGENFNVTFVLEGENKPSEFSWSEGSDFQLIWGPQQGSSTSISIINGKSTKSVKYTYTYVLTANSTGRFTLPAASAVVKGNTLTSQQVSIEVVGNGSSSSSSSQGHSSSQSQSSSAASASSSSSGAVNDSDIYMKLLLSKGSAVVGEPITATLKLYQRVDISGFDDARFPTFNGFWSQDITPAGNIQFVRENVNDRIYNSAVIRRWVLVPQQAGQLTIEPSELICNIYVRNPSRGNSIFDAFFDDGYTTVRKRITTPSTRINVSKLPAGAPESFCGGVGTFGISARISKDSLATHEAGSLIVTVSGKGNVSLLSAPKISFPPDFEVYDVKTKDSIDKTTGGTSGSKTYEYPFIPRSYGDFTIEPIAYSYYDITAGRYVTLHTDPIHIKVGRGAEVESGTPSVMAPVVAKKGVKTLGQDIRFITVKMPAMASKGKFFVGSFAFWMVLLLLFVLSAGLWFVFRSIAARRADIAGSKTRKATKMALRRLRLAEGYLKSNVYGAFYEELHKALLGYVSDKLNMPLAELSKDNIAAALEHRGISAELISQFTQMLDACEFARYAPSSGHDAMAAHYNQAASVISSIDSTMKTKKSAPKGAMMLLALLMLAPSLLHAQQSAYVDTLWNRATAAYTQGNWPAAIESYSAIVALGVEAPALYCNIGDACFKAGENARAILWFERALKLDPSFEDARYNLEIASSQTLDDIDSVPEFFVKTWMRKLSYRLDSDAWTWVFLLLLATSFAMALLFVLSPSSAGKKTGFFTGIATLILAFWALGFALSQKADYMKADGAIVMRPVVSAKSSPSSDASTDLFVIHEGTKVKVLDNVDQWTNISLADGRQGWIRTDSIEII